jgi:hypothetical protein
MRSARLGLAIRASISVLALLVTVVAPATAMSCPSPDPWFFQRIALTEEPVLPFGVSLRAVSRASPSDSQFPFDRSMLSWIEVHNDSATPLYLLLYADEFQKQMGYDAISWSTDDLSVAPPGMKTYSKVQSGVAYGWPYNCAVVRCDQIGWSIRHEPIIVASGNWGISQGFEQRVVWKKNRPADVAIPADQTGTFTLAYGGRTIVVPFVVSYELNPTYDPAAGTENCGAGLTVVALVLLAVFVLMTSALVFALLSLTRRFIRRLQT